MKRLHLFALTLLLLLSLFLLAGCKDDDGGQSLPNPEDDSTPSPTVECEGGFSYLLLDNGTYAVAADAKEYGDTLTIPSSFRDKPVTAVGYESPEEEGVQIGFAGFEDIKTVVIPASIKKISSFAFAACDALSTVTFAEEGSLTEIGQYAFAECPSLTEVALPEGLLTLDTGAFFSCYSLRYVTLPSTLTALGNYPFDKCDRLLGITNLSAKNLSQLPESVALEVRTSAQTPFSHSLTTVGSALLLEADGTTYFYGYGGAATALDLSALSFTVIYPYALYNADVQSVKLPAALLTIGDYAFADCAALTSVEFAESSLLSLIGNHAFEGTSISELVLPGTVEELGYAAFANCERLADVTLTEGLAVLGEKAFYHCTALAALQLPVSLEIIGPDALAECTSLTSLSFGDPNHWFTEQGTPAPDLSDAESNALYFLEVAPFLEKGE